MQYPSRPKNERDLISSLQAPGKNANPNLLASVPPRKLLAPAPPAPYRKPSPSVPGTEYWLP
jgi:hypothetical protein